MVATLKSRLVCAIVTMVVLAACGGSSSSSSHATANDPNATFNYAIGPIDSLDSARTKVTNAGTFLVYRSSVSHIVENWDISAFPAYGEVEKSK